MVTTEVIWNSDTCSIPKYGVGEKGKRIFLPIDMAKDFVTRKMAKYPPTKKTEKEVE